MSPMATYASSPVVYPFSSSPVPVIKKRKTITSNNHISPPKKQKIIGGFLEDSSDEEGDSHLLETRDEGVGVIISLDELSQPPESQSSIAYVAEGDIFSTQLLQKRVLLQKLPSKTISIQTSSGVTAQISTRERTESLSYEKTVAQRSTVREGRAQKAYYGIDIHRLMDDAKIQQQLDDAQAEMRQREREEHLQYMRENRGSDYKNTKHQMWTEKYRAKKFTDLVGDERTHRSVLKWLKSWDETVFPGATKLKSKKLTKGQDQERIHRKIMLLTGPPGLGKTTLAHVCARQAGYEALEINASDDRSKDVVKGRIKDVLGTETVRGIKDSDGTRRIGRPVCVIVDEVDGVVTGSGDSGEGGFIKALIDLIQLDQRNFASGNNETTSNGRKKGDKFRMLRPLIMVCNDVYAPSLRPLRTSSVAEIVHVRKPPIDKVISRMKTVFERENIICDGDAIRRLCESSWSLGARKQNSAGGLGAGEGDIRGVLVQGEWLAHKLRSDTNSSTATRLTRKWVESNISNMDSTSRQSGLGRGGSREVVTRVFLEGAGLPNLPTSLSADEIRLVAESKSASIGVTDLRKRAAITALREMIDTCGDHDRLMTDCFAAYPTQPYQDDANLSKPNASYEWLHFHDSLSSRVYSGQEWELIPYLATGSCGFHDLFASADKGTKSWHEERKEEDESDVHPFCGPKADFAAYEALKANQTMLTEIRSSFSVNLLRLFSSSDNIATELIPSVGHMLTPNVKPVVIGGSTNVASVKKESEKACIRTAVRAMGALNISFEKVRVELDGGAGPHTHGGFVYRMEPALDQFTTFHSDSKSSSSSTNTAPAPVRYAVRQVLAQEQQKEKLFQSNNVRHARSSLLDHKLFGDDNDKENKQKDHKDAATKAHAVAAQIGTGAKRDFFGRIVNDVRPKSAGKMTKAEENKAATKENKQAGRVWVSFNEGFSNAVRKPISLKEFLDSL